MTDRMRAVSRHDHLTTSQPHHPTSFSWQAYAELVRLPNVFTALGDIGLGWLAAVASLILSPAAGFIAIRFFEKIEEFAGSFLALALFVMRRRSFLRLLAERAAIRREILALGDEAALRIT